MFTPPIVKGGGNGLSNSAKKAGERAIERDVTKVFAPLTGGSPKTQSSRVIKRLGSLALSDNKDLFWKLASKHSSVLSTNLFVARILSTQYNGFGTDWGFKKAKNYFKGIGTRVAAQEFGSGAGAYLEDASQIKTAYMPIYQRNQGRLWKNGRNLSGINAYNKRVVERKGDLDVFINERQQSVGAIKSGWYKALLSLPRPVINGVEKNAGSKLRAADWITKHSTVAGGSETRFSDTQSDVTVRNMNGNIFGIADQAGVLGLVYGNRVKQMPARIRNLLQADVNKFNKK